MDQVRMGDDDSGPRPTESSATPITRAEPSRLTPTGSESNAEDPTWPSPPPSSENLQRTEKSWFSSLQSLHPKLADFRFGPPRSKPLFQGVEKPSLPRIAILTVLCLIIYPAFYILTFVAKDKSLFVVRLIVGAWCSGGGLTLGYVLLNIGARHLEAATWATVVHMSHEGDGMKLRDLARSSSNPTSLVPAFHLFRSRFRSQETSRRSRRSYDERPWSLILAFFIVLAILGSLLPFLFGRVMAIETFMSNQRKVYQEVSIAGEISLEDAYQSNAQLLNYAVFDGTAYDTTELVYNNDTVYFAQPTLSQFTPDGSGAGTFVRPATVNLNDSTNSPLVLTGRNAPKSGIGAVLRYPQWGIRIRCEKLPEPEVNLIPTSDSASNTFTFALIPRDFLRGLFGKYGSDLPPKFDAPLSSGVLESLNASIRSNIDPSTISLMTILSDDGVGVSLDSSIDESNPAGFWVVETVIIRFRITFTPYGLYPVHVARKWSSDPEVGTAKFGYDAAVCLQKYEPWIIETYNTSMTSPSALRIVGKGDGSTLLSPSGNIRGTPMAGTRYLNTTNKLSTVFGALSNSVSRMSVINSDVASRYKPSGNAHTLASSSERPNSDTYTELSPDRYAISRARIGAAYTLPYLAGSGRVVAQKYADVTVAYVTFKQWQLIGLPILIWILGVIGELLVPSLPLKIPRREFGVYSWLALFQSQELQIGAADDLDKLVCLEELEERFSDKRVKFVV